MATHVISGAGSGIGAVLADRLHERGDDLWLLARSEERASELREEHPGARPLVDRTLPMDEARDGFAAMAESDVFGKIVFTR